MKINIYLRRYIITKRKKGETSQKIRALYWFSQLKQFFEETDSVNIQN